MSSPTSPRVLIIGSLLLAAALRAEEAAAGGDDARLEQQFKATVHPFLQTYCVNWHGKEKTEAELDLTPFSTVDSVVNGFGHWDLVLERLETAEMLPEKVT